MLLILEIVYHLSEFNSSLTFDFYCLNLATVDSNSCNMGKRDLPDMYAQSPRAVMCMPEARGPRYVGIHIR